MKNEQREFSSLSVECMRRMKGEFCKCFCAPPKSFITNQTNQQMLDGTMYCRKRWQEDGSHRSGFAAAKSIRSFSKHSVNKNESPHSAIITRPIWNGIWYQIVYISCSIYVVRLPRFIRDTQTAPVYLCNANVVCPYVLFRSWLIALYAHIFLQFT